MTVYINDRNGRSYEAAIPRIVTPPPPLPVINPPKPPINTMIPKPPSNGMIPPPPNNGMIPNLNRGPGGKIFESHVAPGGHHGDRRYG